jgi:hypothetical protein
LTSPFLETFFWHVWVLTSFFLRNPFSISPLPRCLGPLAGLISFSQVCYVFEVRVFFESKFKPKNFWGKSKHTSRYQRNEDF